MQTKYSNALSLAMLALVLGVLAIFSFSLSAHPAKADNAYSSSMFSVASSSTATVAVTTSTQILATTSQQHTRLYANICNPSAKSVVLALTEGGAADARTNGGIWLTSGQCYPITPLNLYVGSITASSSDQSSVGLLVNEYEN